MKAKQAESQQAGPPATAIAKQKVTEEKTRIDQVRLLAEAEGLQKKAAADEAEKKAGKH